MLRFYYNPAYKYTNRTIINVSNDNEYSEHDYENIDTIDEINAHIIYELAPAEKLPTYIVDLEPDKNGIYRRYFFSGITQLRTNKYQISLLRDVISESQDWKNEQAFIEAGTATDYCKYKRWELPFTNTKVAQQRFNINGANDKSSFFVFYVNTRHENGGVIEDEDLEIKNILPNTAGVSHIDYTVSNLNEIPNFEYVGNRIETFENAQLQYTSFIDEDTPGIHALFDDSVIVTNDNQATKTKSLIGTISNPSNISNYIKTSYYYFSAGEMNAAVMSHVKDYQQSLTTPSNQDSYQIIYNKAESLYNNYVNKIIYNTTDNKAYTIRGEKFTRIEQYTPSQAEQNTLFHSMQTYFGSNRVKSMNGSWCNYILHHADYLFYLQEVGEIVNYDFTFIADARRLPKSAVKCVNIVSDSNATDTTIAQCLTSAMENITNTEDTGRIIDVQYLPFRLATTTSSDIVINGHNITAQFLDTDDYSFITDMDDLTNINKETDTIKIVSPSRASQFLFRPYDNDGNMLFQTKITLKPYASVIYIRPSTHGLLMYDYDDKDCLIINEDNSLTAVTSQWTEYIYSNKNYSNIFEREIQGRAFERTWSAKLNRRKQNLTLTQHVILPRKKSRLIPETYQLLVILLVRLVLQLHQTKTIWLLHKLTVNTTKHYINKD